MRHFESCAASCSLDHDSPRPSSAITRELRGSAASSASPSSCNARCTSRFLPRGLTSISSSGSSCDSRLRYSEKPCATHAGMRSHTAIKRARMECPQYSLLVSRSRIVIAHGPQSLQSIKLADARQHHVHDDVAQIDQHPLGFLLAFDAQRQHARALDELDHFIGERLYVPSG